MYTLGTQQFVLCREVVPLLEVILNRVYIATRVLLVCPLFGGLSSFGASQVAALYTHSYTHSYMSIMVPGDSKVDFLVFGLAHVENTRPVATFTWSFLNSTHATELIQRYGSVRAMRAENSSTKNIEGIRKIWLSARSSCHQEARAIPQGSTVLDLQSERGFEFTPRATFEPEYWTDRLSIWRKLVLAWEWDFDCDGTALYIIGKGSWRDTQLQTIAFPLKCLMWVGHCHFSLLLNIDTSPGQFSLLDIAILTGNRPQDRHFPHDSFKILCSPVKTWGEIWGTSASVLWSEGYPLPLTNRPWK